MGRIIVSENVTLDGVVEDPTGEEGLSRGGWFTEISQADRDAWAQAALREAQDADALLLGRRGYEFFAARWPSRAGVFADRLNGLPKYVISATLDDPTWANSTVLRGDAVAAVTGLKQTLDGDIVVYASFMLVQMLIEHDLVDELRLTIFPRLLGDGKRLLGEIGSENPLHLIRATTLGDNLAVVTYQP
ncbi:MAG: dihydrofolate reductase family protein [Acidobacteriota bacterium]|nr:dihydrofolate reductase family protein [Acidobacteriota bacterium]